MNKTKEMLNILINIRYKYSMNKFEETYGENVQYSRLEQESYIELKDMMTLKMDRKVKFRKFERNGMVLTLRAELTEKEYKKALTFISREQALDCMSERGLTMVRIVKI